MSATRGHHELLMLNNVVGDPWETAVAALSPWIWLKCNYASEALTNTGSNSGSGGNTVTTVTSNAGLTFNNTGIMPSNLSRKTIGVASGNGFLTCTTASSTNAPSAVWYFAYKGNSGGAAEIPWRNGPSGGFFIRFDTTNVTIRAAGTDRTTTFPSASILNNVAHLIGVSISTTTIDLWVDGVKVWAGVFPSLGTATTLWNYLQNGNLSGQKIFGSLGDFIMYNYILTDPQHLSLYTAWS